MKFGLTVNALKDYLEQNNHGGAHLQLVSLLSPSEGGLNTLAIGLLHPQPEVGAA